MAFATDRDLLAVEPTLFQDVPLLAQQRIDVADADLTAGVLTSTSADFVERGIEAGFVALLADTPIEVIERTDAHTLSVSMLRDHVQAAQLVPADATAARLVIRTYLPQLELAHQTMLRLLGLSEESLAVAGLDIDVTAAIRSVSLMRDIETAAALDTIYSAAASLSGEHEPLHRKAQHHRARLSRLRQGALVRIDLDGDGTADHVRRFAVGSLLRV